MAIAEMQMMNISRMMTALGESARASAVALATTSGEQRNAALAAAAAALRERSSEIIAANKQDMAAASERSLTRAMLDRLMLNSERVEAMAEGIETIIGLHDPIGRVLGEWERPNGLHIQRVSVPLGVIGIIYESRPNVTAEGPRASTRARLFTSACVTA